MRPRFYALSVERDVWKARAERAEARLASVEAIKPIGGGKGVSFGAGFASGFNKALELVAEAIASVEP
jgi:hypothetical protein